MENGTHPAVWAAVGRATEQVGGTRVASFLGESYTLPDATWEHFPTCAGWLGHPLAHRRHAPPTEAA